MCGAERFYSWSVGLQCFFLGFGFGFGFFAELGRGGACSRLGKTFGRVREEDVCSRFGLNIFLSSWAPWSWRQDVRGKSVGAKGNVVIARARAAAAL